MKDFLPLFRSKRLKPIWEFHSDVLVWRILFSSKNTIVGETRSRETKSTSYFCIDAHTGKVFWKERVFDEPWWIGIEAIYDQWIIFHRFARPDMPEHRGILMAELSTGKLLWRNDELTYWFTHNQKLYAYKYIFEKRLGYEIDITTGTVLNEYADNIDILHGLRKQDHLDAFDDIYGALFPELYNQEKVKSEIENTIQKLVGENVLEGWIEYLFRNNILIVSYYRKENSSTPETLKNFLVVYDVARQEKRFQEVIVKGIQVPSPDTFFVKDEIVYFIRNQNILTALQPWKS
jgi:hypothetical protein